MGLETYQRKRAFDRTPEPEGRVTETGARRFVVQEHHASQLHYDFRLEMGGVLKSWAVPKGPSLDPGQKRLAVQVEDHPVGYVDFEGEIAEGNYGAGRVVVWDAGTYEPVGGDDPLQQVEAGKIAFVLYGDRLQGQFALVRMQGPKRENQWLLIKHQDDYAERGWTLAPVLGSEGGKQNGRAGARSGAARKAAAPKAPSAPARKRSARSASPFPAASVERLPASKAFARRELSGNLEVTVGRDVVALTHLDRVYWPDEGYTKGDLLRYYWTVADTILPYLKDRPLILKRYPNGVDQPSFFQHDVDVESLPGYVRTFASETEEGRKVNYVLCQNRATLLYLANLGALAHNAWHSRVGRVHCPDWMVFDLDPGQVPFEVVCQTALAVKSVLDRVGLDAQAKTSGSRGIHLYVPLRPVHPYEQVAGLAERVARQVAHERPDLATVERAKKKRPEKKVYVDFLQNAHGKSVAAPYSVRAKPGATVSAPLDWSEVTRCPELSAFTIKTMPGRLKRTGDLFKAALARRQGLARAIEAFDRQSA